MTPEEAVDSICADARWSTKGQHADYCRCILSQVIATATAALRKELAALHGPASRDFTPAEIIRIADELGLLSDDIRHQPTLGKIAAAVSRLSNKYGDVLAERDEVQSERDWLRLVAKAVGAGKASLNPRYNRVSVIGAPVTYFDDALDDYGLPIRTPELEAAMNAAIE